MKKDGLFNLIGAFEEMTKALRPYQDAVSVLQRNGNFAKLLIDPLADRLGVMNTALTKGMFDDKLSRSVSEMLAPYHELTGMQSALTALGDSFSPLIKTDFYQPIRLMADRMAGYSIDTSGLTKALEPLTYSATLIDTSWMRVNNNWMVEKGVLSELDISAISGMKGSFASLCRLEQENSLIPTIPDNLLSASSQIASIATAIKPDRGLEDIFASSRILSDYCGLAVKQHQLIQKSSDQAEIGWRLDLLDAASKYVDRQISWSKNITDSLFEDSVSVDNDDSEEQDDYESAVALIPTHIGYTKRADIDKTASEGLEKSLIVSITEKGKRISEGVLMINRLQLDDGADRVFVLSETVVKGLMDLGNTVCLGDEHLGKIIDGLYFIFYENLEHIKLVIGNGDKEKGDELIRKEEIYQCIFNVKTIRSDLRHDLDHGSANDRKKKLKSVGECYRKYCGGRPLREKDFKRLQSRLYDEIIKLENGLVDMLSPNLTDTK